jgi:hypothetical protein
MPKTKECPLKGFAGHVVFADPLNMEQVFAIEEAQDAATELEPSKFLTKVNELQGRKEDDGSVTRASWSSKADSVFLPAILLCVKEWHLERVPENVTLENFPMTPRAAASGLVNWLWSKILDIYQGETTIPNE